MMTKNSVAVKSVSTYETTTVSDEELIITPPTTNKNEDFDSNFSTPKTPKENL